MVVVVLAVGAGADDENDKMLYFFFAIARRTVYKIVAYPAPVPDKKECIVSVCVRSVVWFGVRRYHMCIYY